MHYKHLPYPEHCILCGGRICCCLPRLSSLYASL